jgi:p38 MAP kinase
VIHRDLKPGNILVSENYHLRICDFGLARVQEPTMSEMKPHISTIYYRAPEIMSTWKRYDASVDIWSTGCILAEMLAGKPLFPGVDNIEQLEIITKVLGSPATEIVLSISNEDVRLLCVIPFTRSNSRLH